MENRKNTISVDSLEILKEQIAKTREELPFTLTINDLVELLPHGKSKISEMLRRYEYPENDISDVIPNQKLGGRRVIPRAWFLAWLYGEADKRIIEEVEYKVNL